MKQDDLNEDEKVTQASRRNFLKIASVGSVAGGAALVMGSPANAEVVTPKRGAGYVKSEHVQTYYDLAKF